MTRSVVFDWIFYSIAIGFSVFWAKYGYHYEKHENKKAADKLKPEALFCWGAAISEFFGSMAGWYSLRVFYDRLKAGVALGGIDTVFIAVAIIGISGYSYLFVDMLGRLVSKK